MALFYFETLKGLLEDSSMRRCIVTPLRIKRQEIYLHKCTTNCNEGRFQYWTFISIQMLLVRGLDYSSLPSFLDSSLIFHPSHLSRSTCTPSLSMHPLLPLSYHPPVLAPSYLTSPIVLAPSPNWSGGRQRIVKGPGRSSGRSTSPKGRSTEIPESSNEQLRSCKQ